MPKKRNKYFCKKCNLFHLAGTVGRNFIDEDPNYEKHLEYKGLVNA